MTKEMRDRERMKNALAGTQARTDRPAMVEWKPTKHAPEKHASPGEQARGIKPARDHHGRFTGKGDNVR